MATAGNKGQEGHNRLKTEEGSRAAKDPDQAAAAVAAATGAKWDGQCKVATEEVDHFHQTLPCRMEPYLSTSINSFFEKPFRVKIKIAILTAAVAQEQNNTHYIQSGAGGSF